jgi:hypothetical protein
MSESPKVIRLSAVREEEDNIRKREEALALTAGLKELLGEIEAGKVAGVAFAVEYVDGAMGTHSFTTSPNPALLHMAATLMTQRILISSILEEDEYEDGD